MPWGSNYLPRVTRKPEGFNEGSFQPNSGRHAFSFSVSFPIPNESLLKARYVLPVGR